MSSDCAYAEEVYDIVPLQVVQWIYVRIFIYSSLFISINSS